MLVYNARKGGAFKLDFIDRQSGVIDTGVVVESQDGRICSSSYLTSEGKCHPAPPFRTVRNLTLVKARRLSPLENVMQRVFMLTVGRFPKVESWVKDTLRNILITKVNKSDMIHVRELSRSGEHWIVRDVVGPGCRVKKIVLNAKASFVYGPSTRFFQPQSMGTNPLVIGRDDFPQDSQGKGVEVIRRYRNDELIAVEIGTADLA